MRIGINEVLIFSGSTGAIQYEMTILPTLLNLLNEKGYGVIVYTNSTLKNDIIDELIGGANCEIIKTPLPAIPTYKRIVKGEFYWKSQLIRDKIDVFHTPYYPIPRTSIPTVLTVFDLRFMVLPSTYKPLRRLFLKAMVPSSIKRASRIVTISQNTKNDIVEHFNKPDNLIEVISCIPHTKFRKINDKTKLDIVIDKYRLPKKFLLFVGHLEPRKNIFRMIKAFRSLILNKEVDHHLVIIGKPNFGYTKLYEMINDPIIAKRIVFTGYVDSEDIASIYSLAELFIFPSLHEGFGIPIVEAMACEVPVVTSNVSSMPEAAGGAAELVDPYDINSIANGIKSVVNDRRKSSLLVKKGISRVKNLSLAYEANKIIETYKRVFNEVKKN